MQESSRRALGNVRVSIDELLTSDHKYHQLVVIVTAAIDELTDVLQQELKGNEEDVGFETALGFEKEGG